MPRVSIGNKKLTNINIGGEHVMGIRKNPEDDSFADPTLAGDAMEKPISRPLRYTPGLKCDAHLESLRPERLGSHRPIQVITISITYDDDYRNSLAPNNSEIHSLLLTENICFWAALASRHLAGPKNR